MNRSLFTLTALILPLNAQLRITEVMSASAHDDSSANGDWFEITNTNETGDINIANFSFDDDSNTPGASGTFPSRTLAPGESAIVLNETTSAIFRNLWNIPASTIIITTSDISNFPGLSSGGDAVFLFNAGGSSIDSFTFGEATEGVSFARLNDGSDVPGNLSIEGVFGAYASDDDSQDIASPGISESSSDPIAPLFNSDLITSGLVGSSLASSAFRILTLDPNPSDTVTITATDLPSWLTLNDLGDGTASFSGTIPADTAGTFTFPVTATDSGNLSTTETFTFHALPINSPIILNEYNGVAPESFLGGGDEEDVDGEVDTRLGRVQGNGGAWVEFLITGDSANPSDPVDLRGWSLTISSDDETRTIQFSDHIALSTFAPGTLLTLTEEQDTSPTAFSLFSNRGSGGYTWSNIWMHDPILIDQDASSHPEDPAISNSNTLFTLRNSADEIVYGPSGESIAPEAGNVNAEEAFRLEANADFGITPLDINYDDGQSSTFGQPNIWSNNTMTQNFTNLASGTDTPSFGVISNAIASVGNYSATATHPGTAVTIVTAPDFLDIDTSTPPTITFTNNRPLTAADVGGHEVTLQSGDGFLAYQLQVLNPAPALIVNEYNAVAPDRYLRGGTLAADATGTTASDSHFGRILGNGGNWLELIVVGDGGPGFTDLTDWTIEVGTLVEVSGLFTPLSTITLDSASDWANVANGTILTFIDENTAGGGLDTEFNRVNLLTSEGYAWTNIDLSSDSISTTSPTLFDTNSNNTVILIRDAADNIIFGPVGEGIAPTSGVGGSEIFELEGNPSPSISSIAEAAAGVAGYDDSSSSSTFGAPNLFDEVGDDVADVPQDFSPFIQTATLFETFLADNGLAGTSATDDSDSDGFSNINEYLFGGNPSQASSFPVTVLDPITETVSTNVRIDDPNFTLTPERSSDLVTWFTDELDVVDSASTLGTSFVLRNVTYTGSEPRQFFRLNTNPE